MLASDVWTRTLSNCILDSFSLSLTSHSFASFSLSLSLSQLCICLSLVLFLSFFLSLSNFLNFSLYFDVSFSITYIYIYIKGLYWNYLNFNFWKWTMIVYFMIESKYTWIKNLTMGFYFVEGHLTSCYADDKHSCF